MKMHGHISSETQLPAAARPSSGGGWREVFPPAAGSHNPRSRETTRVAQFANLHIGSFANYSLKFSFSAKERDTETGLSYFGARYYSSDLSLWLSVDPMSGKYPSLSPYTYCANNPVKLVDPNGEEIVIEDNGGNKVTYTPGAECISTDWKVKKAWNNLNELYNTKEGKEVISEMTAEGSPTFLLTDKPLYEDNTGRFIKDGKGGGTMYMNDELDDIGKMAHELFHGYQEMKGQGGLNCHNEVEANIFTFLTCGVEVLSPRKAGDYSYNKSYLKMIQNSDFSTFSTDFNTMKRGFTQYSLANYNGKYNGIPLGNPKRNLIHELMNK